MDRCHDTEVGPTGSQRRLWPLAWEFWRPYTAIRAGDTDGNVSTVKDATWQSYLETPPVHDYPSTHSALGAGAAEVLKRSFRTDHVPFSMESLTALPANPVRSFNTFTQAANENADSRVSRHPLPIRDRARQGARPQCGQLHRPAPSPAALTARWRCPTSA
jgi:hypothetical protein